MKHSVSDSGPSGELLEHPIDQENLLELRMNMDRCLAGKSASPRMSGPCIRYGVANR